MALGLVVEEKERPGACHPSEVVPHPHPHLLLLFLSQDPEASAPPSPTTPTFCPAEAALQTQKLRAGPAPKG